MNCPRCGSHNIVADEPSREPGLSLRCLDCGKEWWDPEASEGVSHSGAEADKTSPPEG